MGNFGLATDGDADRIGAMDERGNFVDPHKIMALALRYLVEKRGWTRLGGAHGFHHAHDRPAGGQRYGLTLHETPVGFNHIADYMMNEDVLIGGEESGGISFKGHIPEGDGPIMGLLLVEMVAAYGASRCTTWWRTCWKKLARPSTNARTCACATRWPKQQMTGPAGEGCPGCRLAARRLTEVSHDGWGQIHPGG